jgi:hypothetical protein
MRKLLCYGVMSPKVEADNRGVAEGEDGYFRGTTGLPVGLHSFNPEPKKETRSLKNFGKQRRFS